MPLKKILHFFGFFYIIAISFILVGQVFAIDSSVALTEGVTQNYPVVKLLLNQLNKMHNTANREFSLYERSPVDLSKALSDFPIQKYKLLVATSSELERLPTALLQDFKIEKGRGVKAAFALISNEKKSLTEFSKAKIAFPAETSCRLFLDDILINCIFRKRIAHNLWPDMLCSDKLVGEDTFAKLDILLLKYIANINKFIGIELFYPMSKHWEAPYNAVHLYSGDVSFKTIIEDCLKSKNQQFHVKNIYGYQLEKYEEVAAYGIASQTRNDWLKDFAENLNDLQIITKEEFLAVIFKKDFTQTAKRFFTQIHTRLLELQGEFRRDRKSEEAQVLLKEYSIAYRLLKSGIRGIIESADRLYLDDAIYSYDLIDQIHGIKGLIVKLTQLQRLESNEINDIEKTLILFNDYFSARSELPKELIDLNFLSALWRTATLYYLLHHHYYNIKGSDKSSEFLSLTKSTIELLGKSIQKVKSLNQYNYSNLRQSEGFEIIETHHYQKALKRLLDIPGNQK